jgi:hypothetical protein
LPTSDFNNTKIFEGDRIFRPIVYTDRFGDLAQLEFSIDRAKGQSADEKWAGRDKDDLNKWINKLKI